MSKRDSVDYSAKRKEVANAMAEYAKASGDKTYAEKALKLFKDIRRFVATPGYMEPKYLPALEAKGHSLVMILINKLKKSNWNL